MSLFNRFRREEDGYVTLEAIIVMPVLLWIFAACWVYFDAFRQQSVNQKANFVVSDMLSREVNEIDSTYVDSTFELLTTLTHSNATETGLRLTLVQFDEGAWTFKWSDSRGNMSSLAAGDMGDYETRLPEQAMPGDQLILVETTDAHDPVFNVGLDAFTIKSYSFTRPRYAAKMVIAGLE